VFRKSKSVKNSVFLTLVIGSGTILGFANPASAGSVDSLSVSNAACTGYDGEVTVTVTVESNEIGVGEYPWITHAQGGWRVSAGIGFTYGEPFSTGFQYIVADGDRTNQEVDGTWVKLSYQLEVYNSSNVFDRILDSSSIAFDCSTGELDSDFDKAFDSSDNCPNTANADQLDTDGNGQGDVCDPGPAAFSALSVTTSTCTGYGGRVDVSYWYRESDVDESAGEYAVRVSSHLESNVTSLHGTLGSFTDSVQYIVADGDRTNQEVDGTWVKLSYQLSVNNSSNFLDRTLDSSSIAFDCSTGELDSDFDKAFDSADNCSGLANESQTDTDGNGAGDACDDDDDGDGVADTTDNCLLVVNADQVDVDTDGIGDACDSDVVVPTTSTTTAAPTPPTSTTATPEDSVSTPTVLPEEEGSVTTTAPEAPDASILLEGDGEVSTTTSGANSETAPPFATEDGGQEVAATTKPSEETITMKEATESSDEAAVPLSEDESENGGGVNLFIVLFLLSIVGAAGSAYWRKSQS